MQSADPSDTTAPSPSEPAEALWALLASCSPGDKLAPEPVLAAQLGLGRSKLRELLRTLEDDGILSRVPGVGTTLLHSVQLHADLSVNVSVTELIRTHGLEPGTRELRLERRPSTRSESHQLGIANRAPVWEVDRVRTANGSPIATTLHVLPADIIDTLNTPITALAGDSLYEYLASGGYRIERAVAHIVPAQADEATAARLDVSPGQLLLRMEQVEYDERGRTLILASECYVGDAFSFVLIRRSRPRSFPAARRRQQSVS